MTDEWRLIATHRVECCFREKTFVGEYRVERLDRVTFALNKPIPVGVLSLLWGNVHHVIVENVQDVDAGQASTCMALPGIFDNGQEGPTVLDGFAEQFLSGRHRRCSNEVL